MLGAAAAFTAITDGYRVTAVGEVPPATVKAIAESLRPVQGPASQLAGTDASGEHPQADAARDLRSLGAPPVPPLDRNALRP